MNLCQYCWLYKTNTQIHPMDNKLICYRCRLGEINYRTKQLEDWIVSTKKPVPTSFSKQLQSLDQIEGHLRNKLKSMTYEALKTRLLSTSELGRYDGQKGMI